MFENEVREIIDEYRKAVEAAGSEYKRQYAMEYAFNRILEVADLSAEAKKYVRPISCIPCGNACRLDTGNCCGIGNGSNIK